jgi:hypothetical protein
MKSFYWILRTITVGLGLLLLLTVIEMQRKPPNLEMPTPIDAPVFFGTIVLLGVVLLAPNYWNSKTTVYWARLSICMVAIIWVAAPLIESIGIAQERPYVIVGGMVFVILTLAIVASMILSRTRFPRYY